MEQETTTHRSGRKFDGKSNLIIGLGAVVVILIIVAFANFGGSMFSGGKKLSPDEAKAKALDFINKNLVQGTTASITSVTDYSDSLYKLSVQVGTNNIDSYMTKDGKQFFPQAMNIDDVNNGTVATGDSGSTPAAPVVPTDLPKNDKPKVELFVMSHCPYGTQIEKGIVPVMKTLGNKADIQIKFVNYVMHGESELVNNIDQYCINKEQPEKYTDFLSCFLKAGDATGCMASTGIDKKKHDACYSATDKQYNLTADFNDKSKWNGSFPTFAINDAENKAYGVQGSPTLVINGKQVESNRDSQSLLTTICAAFNNAPSECQTKLDTATPSAGFGEGTAAAGSGSAAACAPAS
jgi:protein-disulfide isomerase